MEDIASSVANKVIEGGIGYTLLLIAFWFIYKQSKDMQQMHEDHAKQIQDIYKANSEYCERQTSLFTARLDDAAKTAAQERAASIAGFNHMGDSFNTLQITMERIVTMLQAQSNNGRN